MSTPDIPLAETILGTLTAKKDELSAFVTQAGARVDEVGQLFTAIEARLTMAEGFIKHLQEKQAVIDTQVRQIQQLPRDLQQAIVDTKEAMESQIQGGVEDIEEFRELVTERLDETCADVQEAIENCGAEVRGHMTAGVEAVQELLDGIAGDFEDRADNLLEYVTGMREKADEMAEELFKEVVPEAIGEQGAALMKGIQTLKETGVDQMQELNKSVGVIRDKTEVLTNFVEKVKPILEIARSI